MSSPDTVPRKRSFPGRLWRWTKRVFFVALFAYFLMVVVALSELLNYRFRILPPPEGAKMKVLTFFGASIDALFFATNRIRRSLDFPEKSGKWHLPDIFINVDPAVLDQLASDPPRSAKARYYPAYLPVPGGTEEIELRFRGRSIWHFHREKPSLRLRFPSGEFPRHLRRVINLVNPEDRAMVSNPLGEELARSLGVIAPVTDLVAVIANGDYLGVYQRTTHEDSFMLHMNGRLPGPFYSGEHLKRRWASSHFDVKEESTEIGNRPLRKLIKVLEAPLSVENLEELWETLSFEKYTAWVVAMNITGGIHTDYIHNNLLYKR